jgi:hypothetical protein
MKFSQRLFDKNDELKSYVPMNSVSLNGILMGIRHNQYFYLTDYYYQHVTFETGKWKPLDRVIQSVPELADQIYSASSLVTTESNSVLKKGQGIIDFL